MCNLIGDIPIQSKEQKYWVVGGNRGTTRVEHGIDGVDRG